VARAIAFARGLSGKAVVLAVVVFGLQAAMPEGRRPSDAIGGFHGSTESAEIKAKQQASVDFQQNTSNAQAGPQATWQMEQALNQTQLQAQLKALEMQEEAAQIADLACMGAGFVTPFFGNTPDSRAWRDTLQQGCHAAEAIRVQMNEILARAAREGSGVVVRNSGSPSSLTRDSLSRAPISR
jgi:hypothetical protein